MDQDVQVHRALASPVRGRLLDLLRDAAAPLAVVQLAGAIGLHPNTVRAHLAVLGAAGLVVSERSDPEGPGRPGLVYRASSSGASTAVPESSDAEVAHDAGYRLLASLLADQVSADHPDVARVAEDAALAWGRRLASAAASGPPRSVRDTVQLLIELLALVGFDPTIDGDLGPTATLLLARCPFEAVARSHPDLACAVHRGLLRGALDAFGGEVELAGFVPDRASGPCVAELRASS